MRGVWQTRCARGLVVWYLRRSPLLGRGDVVDMVTRV